MITISQEQGMNVITLVKYEEYNGKLSDTASDTRSDTDIMQEISELRKQVTQLLTQQATQLPKEPKSDTQVTQTNKRE